MRYSGRAGQMSSGLLIGLLVSVAVFCVSAWPVLAQDKKEEKIPEGMEVVQVKQTKHVVPVGMTYRKKGDLIIMESPAEYTARRLAAMEERLAKIETQVQALSQKLDQLTQLPNSAQQAQPAMGENNKPSQ